MRVALLILICTFFQLKNAISQSLQLGFLFKPGVTIGTEFTPETSFKDSGSFQLSKYKAQFVIPLKTKIGLDIDFKKFELKKLDAKASQTFLTINTSARIPKIKIAGQDDTPIYTGAIGITHLSASIKKGIWLYSGNLYLSESSESLTMPNPNFMGYFAKIKLNSLRFIYFYGAAVLYNQGSFLPVPLFGFTYQITPKTRGTVIFPVQAKVTQTLNSKTTLDLATVLSGFNAVYRQGSALSSDDGTINYRHLKFFLAANHKIKSQFRVTGEIGLSLFRNLSFSEPDLRYPIKPAPYVSIVLNYRFSRSVFENFIEGVD